MKNVFGNVNNQVVKHSFGIKDINEATKISSGAAAKDVFNKIAALEHCAIIEERAKKSEKEYNARQTDGNIAMKKIAESSFFMKADSLYKEGRVNLFKDIIFEMFSKALYLDPEVIVEHHDNLKALCDEYIDKNGGYIWLEKAIESNHSPILISIKEACDKIAKEVCQRKIKTERECSDATDLLNFSLNEEEEEKLNYEKGKIGIDDIADLVKSKVLTVIQDEKAREEEEEELMNDIKDELKNDESVKDQKTLNEALRRIQVATSPVEESTLFNSLFRNSYKQTLLETTTVKNNSDALVIEEEKEKNKNDDTTVYKIEHETEDSEKVPGAELIDSDELEIDMDLILAEAITKYTLLEMLYTIKLENFTYEQLQKMSWKLLEK